MGDGKTEDNVGARNKGVANNRALHFEQASALSVDLVSWPHMFRIREMGSGKVA